jgi:hypothetical protein
MVIPVGVNVAHNHTGLRLPSHLLAGTRTLVADEGDYGNTGW